MAYPGLLTQRNLRPAVAQNLTEPEVAQWQLLLRSIGFVVERQYEKARVACRSEINFHDHKVELEIDQFSNSNDNGPLADRSFVSISVEVPGDQRASAELALDEALEQLRVAGMSMTECEGNYESYYYKQLKLPGN